MNPHDLFKVPRTILKEVEGLESIAVAELSGENLHEDAGPKTRMTRMSRSVGEKLVWL